MVIPRSITADVTKHVLERKKAVIVYGPRQVGKTTLVTEVAKSTGLKTLYVNGDQPKTVSFLTKRDADVIRQTISGYQLLVIDEAQQISDIGINLKICIDNFPNVAILVTGSSSFELANRVREPLTGRTWSYTLYPISAQELHTIRTPYELTNELSTLLVYGSYPRVYTTEAIVEKTAVLSELAISYLFRDVLALGSIKYDEKLRDLVSLLAYQIGSEVSVLELSNRLEIHRSAVDHYIDVLEKSFIIFRLSGFSRNLRKEVRKMDKIYFYDVGVRNTMIDNLKPLSERNDVGQLWENFLMIERMKYLSYARMYGSSYFWRTHTGAELDLVEDREGKLSGYEFKWGEKIARTPQTFLTTYKDSTATTINRKNYLSFISSTNT